MRIIIADDEPLMLKDLERVVRSVRPKDEIHTFSDGMELLQFAMENPCEVAFLDIRMGDIDGVTLAKELKDITPRINIIFVTAYDDHFRDAMEMHASAYILKPAKKEAVERELQDLRYEVDNKKDVSLYVTCFGGFDVKAKDGTLVKFERSKSKEAFAYLIHNHGTTVTTRDLAAALFEDEEFDDKKQVYIQKIISAMMKTLRRVGAEDVVNKGFNSMSVNVDKVDCDYYRFLDLNKDREELYANDYMIQYPWAEY